MLSISTSYAVLLYNINAMPLRVFYCFPIKKIPIINACNRKITFNTFFRSHCSYKMMVNLYGKSCSYFQRNYLSIQNTYASIIVQQYAKLFHCMNNHTWLIQWNNYTGLINNFSFYNIRSLDVQSIAFLLYLQSPHYCLNVPKTLPVTTINFILFKINYISKSTWSIMLHL